MMRKFRTAALLVVAGVALGACSKKQPVVQPQPLPTPAQTTPQPQQPSTPVRDGGAERAAEIERVMGILEQIVFFDYDEFTIRRDAQEMLAAKVPLLRQYPSIRLRIEGHADERGSVEYNLALGMRRANAVRDYLAGFGLDPNRFETISYGEDQPRAQGSGEAVWARNRRAEFRATGLQM
jgi:peptidoglycan-associated lipoprotein